MSQPARLSLAGIRKSFGPLDVLADVTLHVGHGEFVSMLGPSGAGKSTLFQVLTGAIVADAGQIVFDGAPLDKASDTFAFMPQRDALMPWRRIIDNATLGLEVQGLSKRMARAQVEPLLETFGLAGSERHYPQPAIRRHATARSSASHRRPATQDAVARRTLRRARRAHADFHAALARADVGTEPVDRAADHP